MLLPSSRAPYCTFYTQFKGGSTQLQPYTKARDYLFDVRELKRHYAKI